jgi:hypothetical protein
LNIDNIFAETCEDGVRTKRDIGYIAEDLNLHRRREPLLFLRRQRVQFVRGKEQVAPEIPIPAYVNPSGRDSLGRGLDAGSVAAVVAADRAVQRERESLAYYLSSAYRDPHAAKTQLDEMVKRQGRTSTAARIAQDPAQLGELRDVIHHPLPRQCDLRVNCLA